MHLTGQPHTIRLACILYLGPKRKRADFLALTAIQRKSSSNSQRLIVTEAPGQMVLTTLCHQHTEISVQIAPILHPILVLLTKLVS